MNRHVCLHHMIYLPTFHYLRLILYDVTFQQTSTRIAALHFSLYLFSIEAIHLQILFSGSSLTSPAFYYSLFLRHPILSQKYLALFFECLSGRQQMFIHSSLKAMIVYQRMSLRAYEYTLYRRYTKHGLLCCQSCTSPRLGDQLALDNSNNDKKNNHIK